MKTAGRSVTFDEMLDALADVERRRLLTALVERSPRAATDVVVADTDGEATDDERLALMRHLHLPALADDGFVEWNEGTHEVARGPTFELIRPLLELLDDHEGELPGGML